jgi:hypothetical protein
LCAFLAFAVKKTRRAEPFHAENLTRRPRFVKICGGGRGAEDVAKLTEFCNRFYIDKMNEVAYRIKMEEIMGETDYAVLKNRLKEIVCKIFTEYKKEHTSQKICGMVLWTDTFETDISMGIFNDEHIKNNREFLLNNIWDEDGWLTIIDENEDEWCELIENNELDDFNKTLSEKLSFFPPVPIQQEADWKIFIDNNVTRLTLAYEVLVELNKEQYFNELGKDFVLLFVNYELASPGSFVVDIKNDIDGLFDYKLSGWYREIFDHCYEVNEEEEYEDED